MRKRIQKSVIGRHIHETLRFHGEWQIRTRVNPQALWNLQIQTLRRVIQEMFIKLDYVLPDNGIGRFHKANRFLDRPSFLDTKFLQHGVTDARERFDFLGHGDFRLDEERRRLHCAIVLRAPQDRADFRDAVSFAI